MQDSFVRLTGETGPRLKTNYVRYGPEAKIDERARESAPATDRCLTDIEAFPSKALTGQPAYRNIACAG